MNITIGNNALENCGSIEQVAALINNDIATDATREEVAAAYAMSCLEEGLDVNEENLDPHFDLLIKHGADFVAKDALDLCLAPAPTCTIG
tara:strand:- start:1906 stop:2175 length:270 start_codon:yes stop_codon:yes gene_type:complete